MWPSLPRQSVAQQHRGSWLGFPRTGMNQQYFIKCLTNPGHPQPDLPHVPGPLQHYSAGINNAATWEDLNNEEVDRVLYCQFNYSYKRGIWQERGFLLLHKGKLWGNKQEHEANIVGLNKMLASILKVYLAMCNVIIKRRKGGQAILYGQWVAEVSEKRLNFHVTRLSKSN